MAADRLGFHAARRLGPDPDPRPLVPVVLFWLVVRLVIRVAVKHGILPAEGDGT